MPDRPLTIRPDRLTFLPAPKKLTLVQAASGFDRDSWMREAFCATPGVDWHSIETHPVTVFVARE